MWPFNRKESGQEWIIIRNTLSRYIDERLISVISEKPEAPRMSKKPINFAMILVNQNSRPEQSISEIVTLAQKHDGLVDSMTGTLVTVCFGIPLEQPNQKKLRLAFIGEVSEKLGPLLAVLHGECECPVGKVGNEHRMSYTAFLPDFKAKLGRLCSLEFGQIIEE